jgi:hypothetical protein
MVIFSQCARSKKVATALGPMPAWHAQSVLLARSGIYEGRDLTDMSGQAISAAAAASADIPVSRSMADCGLLVVIAFHWLWQNWCSYWRSQARIMVHP